MALLLQSLFCATAPAPADARRTCTGGDSVGSIDLSSSQSLRIKKLAATRLSSPSNPIVKHCVKLRLSSSYRRSCGSAIVVGLIPIIEVCRFQELNNEEISNIECLLLLDGMEIPELFNLSSTSIVHVSPHVMKKLSGVQSADSTEAVAIMKIPRSFYDMLGEHKEEIYPSWFPSPKRILVLDGIQDPGNLGTLLRSSMAFKWVVGDEKGAVFGGLAETPFRPSNNNYQAHVEYESTKRHARYVKMSLMKSISTHVEKFLSVEEKQQKQKKYTDERVGASRLCKK